MRSFSIGGVDVSLLRLNKNKRLTCAKDCWRIDSCDLKRALSLKPAKAHVTAVLASINVKNCSSQGWSMDLGKWELIDDDGFAYRAHNLCDELRPPRYFEAGQWNVSPGTQVNFMIAFPELEDGKTIARIIYVSDGRVNSFEINSLKDEAARLFEIRENELEQEAIENDWELRNIRSLIDDLDLNVFSRLNNVLAPKEIQKLENMIQNISYRIEQKLRVPPTDKQKVLRDKYEEVLSNYASKIEERRSQEKEALNLSKKVSALYNLQPREFEEYVAELFKVLGYKRINLTPLSNDKGVDILMEKDGKRVAVQCKKYKGVVGSPAIQAFIGAIEHAGATHGFFVTTSTFTIEAEKMASEHPIELVDCTKLGQLITDALGSG